MFPHQVPHRPRSPKESPQGMSDLVVESAPMTVMGTSVATRRIAGKQFPYLYLIRASNGAWQRRERRDPVVRFAENEHKCSSACLWITTLTTSSRRQRWASHSEAGSRYSWRNFAALLCRTTSTKRSKLRESVGGSTSHDRSCRYHASHKSEDPQVCRPGIFKSLSPDLSFAERQSVSFQLVHP